MRAADAVARHLVPPPEERVPVMGSKPLKHSTYRRHWRGTPPRRDADCGLQRRILHFHFFVPAPPQGLPSGTMYC
jgi:hypothetical protein